MTNRKLDLSDLGQLVFAERTRRGLSLRDAAVETEIPLNTLARVERGHVPDLQKFKRLVEWCGADIQQFFEVQERATATPEVIAELLRADQYLSDGAAERIAGIIGELYQALSRRPDVVSVHLRAAKTFRPEAANVLGSLLDDLNRALVEEDEDGAT